MEVGDEGGLKGKQNTRRAAKQRTMQALLLPARPAVRSAGPLVASSSPPPLRQPKSIITTPTPPAIAPLFQRPNLSFSSSRTALTASFHPLSFASAASAIREPASATVARAASSFPSAADNGSEKAKLAQVRFYFLYVLDS